MLQTRPARDDGSHQHAGTLLRHTDRQAVADPVPMADGLLVIICRSKTDQEGVDQEVSVRPRPTRTS
jgi:hypothetical protein